VNAVECTGLGKVFNRGGRDEVTALRDVDLTVAARQFVSLIGPSGCGKSTLLRLVADLVEPSTGTVRVAGKPAPVARRDQEYGMVFQQAGLFEWRTVRHNVELPLELRGTARRVRAQRAGEMLDLVGLADFAGHYPAQLSGGMQQRVAIARALANRPTLLLADEPTGELDARTGAEMIALFERLNADGTTIIVVTHDEELAAAAKRVIHMRDGRIVADARAR